MTMTINNLDPSQHQVLDNLLRGEQPLSVVYGPPGTGKSHLIVSLLFALATKGERVLFVSQNIEALEVIDRMYRRLESDYKLGSNHLSFLDFCLQLTKPEQRSLKYIRGLRDRLHERQLRSSSTETITNETSHRPYELRYTHVDKNAELIDVNSSSLALDELITYYLRFVGERDILPDTIKNISKINAREIWRLLDNYERSANIGTFAEYNHPTNALSWLEKTKTDSSLAEIHAFAEKFRAAADKLPHSWRQNIIANQKITINNWLHVSKKLLPLTQYYNLAKICQDKIDNNDLTDKLTTLLAALTQMEPAEDLALSPKQNTEIFLDLDMSHFENDDQLRKLDIDAASLPQKINQLQEAGLQEDQDFFTLRAAVLYVTCNALTKLLSDFPGLATYDHDDLVALQSALTAWQKQNSWQHLLSKIPEIVKNAKSKLSRKDLQALLDKSDELTLLSELLEDTSYNLDRIQQIIKSHQKAAAWNPLQNVDASQYRDVAKICLQISNSLQLSLDKTDKLTLSDVVARAQKLQVDFITYRQIVRDNRLIAEQLTIPGLIAQINKSIRNREREKAAAGARQFLQPYVLIPLADIHQHLDTLQKMLSLWRENHWENISPLITVTGDLDTCQPDTFDQLATVVSQSQNDGSFSDDFYDLQVGQNLNAWQQRAGDIRAWQNLAAFDEFIAQQKLIANICQLLGPDNAENLSELLAGDVSWSDLTAKITVDLVSSIYQTLPSSERTVIPANYFDKINAAGQSERRDLFLRGLSTLKSRVMPEAAVLKVTSNWCPARTTMEKIRANSRLLINAYPIIIATPKEVSKYLDAQAEMFDTVVFDEASQTLPGQALPSIYRAKKAIIVGDPHQMPPTLTTAIAFGGGSHGFVDEEELVDEISILDLAIRASSGVAHHLQVHYRSESNVLFEPSRRAIYADYDIQPIVESKSNQQPVVIRDNLGTDDLANFAAIVQTITDKLRAEPDTSFCLLFTRKLGVGEKEFRQYLAHNPELAAPLYKLLEKEKLLISTVTNCQGIEAEHAIIYFNYYKYPSGMWFFKEQAGAYKRLNVAITRQRRSLTILMANSRGDWLAACDKHLGVNATPNALKSAELMQTLLADAGEIIDGQYLDGLYHLSESEIDSPLTRALYHLLCTHFAAPIANGDMYIWANIGKPMLINDTADVSRKKSLNGFRVDIGIYSTKCSQFLLGIEIDSSVYHDDFDLHFADEGRHQTLIHNKGWDLYRFWSSNWLADTRGEWQRLLETIEQAAQQKAPPSGAQIQESQVAITPAVTGSK